MGKSAEYLNEGKGLYLEAQERKLIAARGLSEKNPHYTNREFVNRMPQNMHEAFQNQAKALNSLNESGQLGEATTVFEAAKYRFGSEVVGNKKLPKKFRAKKGRR